MGKLVDWAKSELDRLVKEGSRGVEMQKKMNSDVLQIVETFANQGHSGSSASYALNLIKRLLNYKPITPLTGEDDEWSSVKTWDNGEKLQQNKRCSSVFRTNFDNSTAHDIDRKVFSDDGGKTWYQKGGKGSAVSITFPYYVPNEPERIILNENKEESE